LDILENRREWQDAFQNGWLRHLNETGEYDWMAYRKARIRNEETPAAPPVDLSRSKLLLITSSGAYMAFDQIAFDAENKVGDYSIRRFPSDLAPGRLNFAHDHYDHADVDQDPEVLVPLQQLADRVRDGEIGRLAPETISFMGYQPDAVRVVDEMIPRILRAAREMNPDAALLVPA
jgi:hypothetical protein